MSSCRFFMIVSTPSPADEILWRPSADVLQGLFRVSPSGPTAVGAS
jgi:hypothetical protein